MSCAPGALTHLPMTPDSAMLNIFPGASSPQFRCRLLYRVDNTLVAGTAAEVSRDRGQDFVTGRIVIGQQQGITGNEHSRRTKAALKSPGLAKRALQGMQFTDPSSMKVTLTEEPRVSAACDADCASPRAHEPIDHDRQSTAAQTNPRTARRMHPPRPGGLS